MRQFHATIIALVTFVFSAIAQIPNAGFETWTTVSNRMLPTGWHGANDMIDSTATYFPITRATDHFPATIGSYSIRMECNPIFTAPISWGAAMTTRLDGNDRPLFPITGHPTSLYGYYKYLPQKDTMDIHIVLYNHGAEIVSGHFSNFQTVSEWTQFKISIPTYTSADSARITMAAFSEGKNKSMTVYGNSILFADNLSFDTPINLVHNVATTSKAIEINLTYNNLLQYQLASTTSVSMRIFDLNGRVIFANTGKKHLAGAYSMPLPLHHVSSGMYLLEFNAADFSTHKRFMVTY